MTALLFPDNTVLVNFALVGRMDLLDRVAGHGRGRWCGSVARECRQSAQTPGLSALTRAHDIFGTPLYPETAVERLEARQLRIELASPGEGPTEHLGEAETVAIMTNRPELRGFFVTGRSRRRSSGGPPQGAGDHDVGPPPDPGEVPTGDGGGGRLLRSHVA